MEWLAAHGAALVALGGVVLALLSVAAVSAAARATRAAATSPLAADGSLARLRRQIEPLATGDLAVRLPQDEGATGQIARTLNPLIGSVSDLVGTAQAVTVQLTDALQSGRGALAGLQLEVAEGRQLTTELAERADQAAAAARVLAGRLGGAEPSSDPSSLRPAGQPTDPSVRESLVAQIEGIVEVMSDLAEQAQVLAVGASIQAAAPDATPALRAVGDDVRQLAEQASRAVGQVEPLVQAVTSEVTGAGRESPGHGTGPHTAGLAGAAGMIADQVAAMAELAASLRENADQVARSRDEASSSLVALADLANRLRRATGRFRVPGT